MAGASAIRDATMDEILASIREIIEENTARSEALGEQGGFVAPIIDTTLVANDVTVPDVSTSFDTSIAPNTSMSPRVHNEAVTRALQAAALAKSTPPINTVASQPSFERKRAEVISSSREIETAMLRPQATDVAKEKISVDDAMNALARRIGLNVEKIVKEKDTMKEIVEAVEEAVVVTQEEERKTVMAEEKLKQDKPIMSGDPASAIRSIVDEDELYDQAEALVDEVLRPVLKKWLQQNLSIVVRKIMREELAKAVKSLH